MEISELEAAMASAPSKQPDKHCVTFLPYLRLKRSYAVAGVEFVPLRDDNGTIPSILASAVAPLDVILSGYVDRNDVPLKNCVVATVPGRGWNLTQPDDFGNVRWAASLPFLASWARNEYFPKFGGSYVNSTQFRVVAQAYSGDMPHYIAFSARRRDGGTSGGVVARSLGGNVRVRTARGSVNAELTGEGDTDVETRSSAIRIRGARGSVSASSRSGRVSVSGVPNRPWAAHSGSGGVDIAIDTNASLSLDATSGSGSVRVDGAAVRGSVSKRKVTVASPGRSSRVSPFAPGTRDHNVAAAFGRPGSIELSFRHPDNAPDGLRDH